MKLNHLFKNSVFAVVMGLLVLIVWPLHATDNPLHQAVDGLEVYLGVLPAGDGTRSSQTPS